MVDPAPIHHEKLSLEELAALHKSTQFLAPSDLSVQSNLPRRILLIGSCAALAWQFHQRNPDNVATDFILTNNLGALPQTTLESLSRYDLIIVQPALRFVMPDGTLWLEEGNERNDAQTIFEQSAGRLKLHLDTLLTYTRQSGIPTLVCGFMTPYIDSPGRLHSRFSYVNPAYFVGQLNEVMELHLDSVSGAHYFDIDRIVSTFGKAYFQDDALLQSSHGSLFHEFNHAGVQRLEPVAPVNAYFHYNVQVLREAIWGEIRLAWRTLNAVDAVKMVVTDLDDTLWQGVVGDMEPSAQMVENWHMGYIDALMSLRKRGVLLAIISKNEEAIVQRAWSRIFGSMLSLDAFALRRINWLPKVENMTSLLEQANLLPRSVVYIDDNPVERAGIQSAFPDLRVLGKHPLYLRKILLCSSETQRPAPDSSASLRERSLQQKALRDVAAQTLSREDFLADLKVETQWEWIDDESSAHFARAFELLNKTNQFNSTGRRWTGGQIRSFFERNGRLLACIASDRHVQYGLISVALLQPGLVRQWVMSCRAFGIGIEERMTARIVEYCTVSASGESTSVLLKLTDANAVCQPHLQGLAVALNAQVIDDLLED